MPTRSAICAHLRPLADALAAAGISVQPMESPYGGSATWWRCGCTFGERALRARLSLAPCVKYLEYDGHAAGADATFTCTEHDVVFLGPHPRWTPKTTPHLK